MNAIQDMRKRLVEEFSQGFVPMKGLDVATSGLRVTRNDAPRFPQSNVKSEKVEYTQAGRPPKSNPNVFRKWGTW